MKTTKTELLARCARLERENGPLELALHDMIAGDVCINHPFVSQKQINGEFLSQLDPAAEIHLYRERYDADDGLTVEDVLCVGGGWSDAGSRFCPEPMALTVAQAERIIRNGFHAARCYQVIPATK